MSHLGGEKHGEKTWGKYGDTNEKVIGINMGKSDSSERNTYDMWKVMGKKTWGQYVGRD